VTVGSGVGLSAADDGGAVAVGDAVTDALPDAVGLAVTLGPTVALGAADCVADAVAAADSLVGGGAGGPKQPASANRAPTPRTLSAVNLGLVMMPP
jgi:hypothetical protein